MNWNMLDSGSDDHRSVEINFKAIIVLLLLAAGTAGGVHYLHLQQVARNTPRVLEEAKKRLAAEEYASALAYYQTYLGYRPNDAEAIVEQALLKAKLVKGMASAVDAFFSLQRALNLKPDREDVQREMVRLGVLLKRERECEQELNALLEQNPKDPEVLQFAAQAAYQSRQFELARTRYELLLQQNPQDERIALTLIQLLTRDLKDLPAADAILARLLEQPTVAPEVHAFAAGYYLNRGQLDQAERQLTAALSGSSSASPELLRLQSQLARLRRRPLELEASLSVQADNTNHDPRAELELAGLELSLGRRASARQRLLRLGQNEAATPEHLWQAVLALDEAGYTDDFSKLREILKQKDGDGAYAASLVMRDKMRLQDWRAALELERGVSKQSAVSDRFIAIVKLWRAECQEQLNDPDGQINSLRRAVAADERFPTARSRLARVLFERGNLTDAQTEYTALIQLSPGHAGEYVALLQAALEGKAGAKLTRKEVDALFARWQAAAPDQPLAALCQLELVQRLDDKPEVLRLTEAGVQHWPKEVGFRLSRIDALRIAKDWPAALAQIDQAEEICGNQAALLGRRIVTLEAAAPDDLTEQMQRCADQFAKLDRDGQALIWPLMVRGLSKAGIEQAAIADILEDYGEKNPKDAVVQLALVQQAIAEGDLDDARPKLEVLKEAVGDEAPAYRLASVMYDLKAASLGDQTALAKAKIAFEKLQALPDFPAAVLLNFRADLAQLERRPLDAVNALQEALLAGDLRRSLLVRTLALMVAYGQLDQVVPFVGRLQSIEASAAGGGQPVAAADRLPQPLELAAVREVLDPVVAESWQTALAAYRIDLELKRVEAADGAIRHAVRLAPDKPIVWANWLGHLELRHPDQLEAALADAQAKLPAADQGRLLTGHLIRLRRVEEAQQILEAARTQAPADANIFRNWIRVARHKPEELEQVLQDQAADERPELSGCREVARRELARVWAFSKSYPKYQESLKLLDDVLKDAVETDEEAIALQAEILGMHAGYWREAVAALRRLAASERPQVRFEAYSGEARLHERRRHWDDEQTALAACRGLAPGNPQLLTRLLLNAVRRRDAAAATELREALRSATENPLLLIQADVLQGSLTDDRGAIAARVLAMKQADEVKREIAVEWLSLLKADDALDTLLKGELDPKRIGSFVNYALFLSSRGRSAEAMPLLSQIWKSGDRDHSATIATTFAASPHVSPDDLKTIRIAVKKMAEAEDASFRMMAAAATLADHAGEYDDARALYRRMLAQTPDNVVALNNGVFLAALTEAQPAAENVQQIDRAMELSGPVDQLLDTKGVLLLRMGRTEEALACLEQAWNQKAEPTYLAHLAWALTDLKRFDEAAKRFQEFDAAEPPARLHRLESAIDAAHRRQALGETTGKTESQ